MSTPDDKQTRFVATAQRGDLKRRFHFASADSMATIIPPLEAAGWVFGPAVTLAQHELVTAVEVLNPPRGSFIILRCREGLSAEQQRNLLRLADHLSQHMRHAAKVLLLPGEIESLQALSDADLADMGLQRIGAEKPPPRMHFVYDELPMTPEDCAGLRAMIAAPLAVPSRFRPGQRVLVARDRESKGPPVHMGFVTYLPGTVQKTGAADAWWVELDDGKGTVFAFEGHIRPLPAETFAAAEIWGPGDRQLEFVAGQTPPFIAGGRVRVRPGCTGGLTGGETGTVVGVLQNPSHVRMALDSNPEPIAHWIVEARFLEKIADEPAPPAEEGKPQDSWRNRSPLL